MPWTLGPFTKVTQANPCLKPNPHSTFFCPMQGRDIGWEEKDVFNPAAVVRDGRIYLFYRAEDRVGIHAGTSRVGIAVSDDGLHFTTLPMPVLYPDHDKQETLEWEGGCEDPRIVETEDGRYLMLYTAYDGKTARLCAATSQDLMTWQKCGPVFAKAHGGKYKDLWGKSGAVVTKEIDGRFVAQKINGKYWMYWGEGQLHVAVSENLIDWTPLETTTDRTVRASALRILMSPRKNRFDQYLCEPGPQAMITDQGILLLYNGKCDNPQRLGGHDSMYQPGQVLFDLEDPTAVIARSAEPFLTPSEEYELVGQVMPTCFIEGLVKFKGQYFLYYGTADSHVAVATCPAER